MNKPLILQLRSQTQKSHKILKHLKKPEQRNPISIKKFPTFHSMDTCMRQYVPEPESEPDEEEEEEESSSWEKTEEMSFPAPLAIIRVGEKISLESQLGFSCSGFVNLGRSYGVGLAPVVRLARTIFPPDLASKIRRDLELVAMFVSTSPYNI